MKVVIGLGNPGFQYRKTRHNVGFMVVDELAKRFSFQLKQKKCHAAFAMDCYLNKQVVLFQPLTFMNASGEVVRSFLDDYHIPIEDIVVIYDDLDLPVGKVRLREKGGAGGHNGVKSLIVHLGTKEFKRIRIGIHHPDVNTDVIDYVLRPFARNERERVNCAIESAASACEKWLTTPFQKVMNEYN